MKTTLLLFALLICSCKANIDNSIDRLNVNGPLEFDNVKFYLATAENPDDKFYIQEYLPEGKDLKNFDQKISVHVFEKDISIKEAVGKNLQELNERKKIDPICNYQVIESADGKEYIVDFVIEETVNDNKSLVEFHVYRYKQVEISNEKKAILIYAFTKRSNEDNITEFLINLKDDRKKYLNEMSKVELPEIAIKLE